MLYKKLHKRVPEIRLLYVTPEKVCKDLIAKGLTHTWTCSTQ